MTQMFLGGTAIRPSPDWTFGTPEAQRYNPNDFLDQDFTKLAPSALKIGSEKERQRFQKYLWQRAQQEETFRYGAHPRAGNSSVRYTFIEHPRDRLWLALRWWSGRERGYYFDVVDLATHAVLAPPPDLRIRVARAGGFAPVDPATYAVEGRPGLEGAGEARFLVPHGATLLLWQVVRNTETNEDEERLVADVEAPSDPKFYTDVQAVSRYTPVSPYDP